MFGFLIQFLILFVILCFAFWLLNMIPIPAEMQWVKKIFIGVVVFCVVIWLIYALAGFLPEGSSFPRFR